MTAYMRTFIVDTQRQYLHNNGDFFRFTHANCLNYIIESALSSMARPKDIRFLFLLKKNIIGMLKNDRESDLGSIGALGHPCYLSCLCLL